MNTRNYTDILLCLTLLVILLFVTSCGLKRSNPLDPEGNPNVHVPPQVTGLDATSSATGASSKWVQLTWDRNLSLTTGYYIYMSLAYNAEYVKIGYTGNIAQNPEETISYIKADIVPGDYFFKVSAYNYRGGSALPPDPPDPMSENTVYLEGPLSGYVYIRVPN